MPVMPSMGSPLCTTYGGHHCGRGPMLTSPRRKGYPRGRSACWLHVCCCGTSPGRFACVHSPLHVLRLPMSCYSCVFTGVTRFACVACIPLDVYPFAAGHQADVSGGVLHHQAAYRSGIHLVGSVRRYPETALTTPASHCTVMALCSFRGMHRMCVTVVRYHYIVGGQLV